MKLQKRFNAWLEADFEGADHGAIRRWLKQFVKDVRSDRNLFEKKLKSKGLLDTIDAVTKDIADTFKPYKGGYQIKRDILQPFHGLGNIFLGVLTPILSSASLILYPIKNFLDALKNSKDDENIVKQTASFLRNFLYDISVTVAKFLIDIPKTIPILARGVAQIVTTPLILFKLPLRLIIGKVKWGSVFQNVEDNPSIKAALKEGDELNKNTDQSSNNAVIKLLQENIQRKVESGRSKGQPTKLTEKQLLDISNFSSDQNIKWQNFKSLFTPPSPQVDDKKTSNLKTQETGEKQETKRKLKMSGCKPS